MQAKDLPFLILFHRFAVVNTKIYHVMKKTTLFLTALMMASVMA